MKDENYLSGIDYAMDIGYAQYLDRKHDDALLSELWRNHLVYKTIDGQKLHDFKDFLEGNETCLFDFDGLFVEVTLPRGEVE